jgi:hypothetical protein
MVTFRRRRKWLGPAPPDPVPEDPPPPDPAPPSTPSAEISKLSEPPAPELRPTFRGIFLNAIQDGPRSIRFGLILALIFAGSVAILLALRGIHIHLPALGIHLRGLNYIITVAAGVGGGAVTSIGGMGLKKLIKALKDPASNDED